MLAEVGRTAAVNLPGGVQAACTAQTASRSPAAPTPIPCSHAREVLFCEMRLLRPRTGASARLSLDGHPRPLRAPNAVSTRSRWRPTGPDDACVPAVSATRPPGIGPRAKEMALCRATCIDRQRSGPHDGL